MGDPKRRPQEIRRVALSSLRPRDGTGVALSQLDDPGEDTARSLAFSDMVSFDVSRLLNLNSVIGMSQSDCDIFFSGRDSALIEVVHLASASAL